MLAVFCDVCIMGSSHVINGQDVMAQYLGVSMYLKEKTHGYLRVVSAVLAVILTLSCWLYTPISVSASTSSVQYPVTATVTQGGVPLKLRKGPSTSTEILAEIPRGSKITITGYQNSSWYKASYSGKNGYVASKYIIMPSTDSSSSSSGYPVTGTVTQGDVPLKLRKGPSTSTEILAEIARGSKITITSQYNSSWYGANHDGKDGYVSSKYVILPENGSSSGSSGNGSSGNDSKPSDTYKYNPISLSVPYYWQYDSRWADLRIGDSKNTIRTAGCIVCGLAGIDSYRTGKTITPADELEMQSFTSTGAIYWPSGTTSYSGNDYLGVVYKQLQAKNPVLLGGHSEDGKQHWVVITGYAGQGITLRASDFIINDSCYKDSTRLNEYQSKYPEFYKIVYYKN